MNVSISALVRPPCPDFVRALSRHPDGGFIDLEKARQQHTAYCQALEQAGATVERLEPLDDFPDSVFIEDNAVILEGRAVLCSMKEASRKDEISFLADTLQSRVPVIRLQPPVFLDGGDVLQTEDTVFVGLSQRTSQEAVEALQSLTPKPVIPVPVKKGLHLKTSVSFLGNNLLVIRPTGVEAGCFKKFEWIEVEEDQAYAANCLAVEDSVILPGGFPQLEQRIGQHGFKTLPVALSEFQKADGGVTCLSLLINEV